MCLSHNFRNPKDYYRTKKSKYLRTYLLRSHHSHIQSRWSRRSLNSRNWSRSSRNWSSSMMSSHSSYSSSSCNSCSSMRSSHKRSSHSMSSSSKNSRMSMKSMSNHHGSAVFWQITTPVLLQRQVLRRNRCHNRSRSLLQLPQRSYLQLDLQDSKLRQWQP